MGQVEVIDVGGRCSPIIPRDILILIPSTHIIIIFIGCRARQCISLKCTIVALPKVRISATQWFYYWILKRTPLSINSIICLLLFNSRFLIILRPFALLEFTLLKHFLKYVIVLSSLILIKDMMFLLPFINYNNIFYFILININYYVGVYIFKDSSNNTMLINFYNEI